MNGHGEREIRPFILDVPQQEVDDLAARLAATRWPDVRSAIGPRECRWATSER